MNSARPVIEWLRMLNWPDVRKLFPATGTCTYLNTAAAPPLSTWAAREGRRFYDEMQMGGDLGWDGWLARVEEVRRGLARFINAETQEVAFAFSTSHGVNLVAQILQRVGGVLTLADEFPSATLPWLQQGYDVRFVASRDRGVITIEDLAAAITPETRILVASHVQYRTGFRFDLEQLGRFCHEHNLIYVVDASQSFGAFPIDVEQAQIDFLVFSGYKWAMAGYGIAGLYVRWRFLTPKTLPVAGWMSMKDAEAFVNDRLDPKDGAPALELGCPHFAPIFALGGALDLFNAIGPARIEPRIHELTGHLHGRLAARGYRVESATDRAYRSGITVVGIDRPEEAVAELVRRKIIVSARGKGLRVSVHVYNDFEDIDRFMAALEDVAPP